VISEDRKAEARKGRPRRARAGRQRARRQNRIASPAVAGPPRLELDRGKPLLHAGEESLLEHGQRPVDHRLPRHLALREVEAAPLEHERGVLAEGDLQPEAEVAAPGAAGPRDTRGPDADGADLDVVLDEVERDDAEADRVLVSNSRSPRWLAPPETVSLTLPGVRSLRFSEKGAAAFRSTVPCPRARSATTGSRGAGRPTLTV